MIIKKLKKLFNKYKRCELSHIFELGEILKDMYHFSSKYINDVILELPHKIGKNCKQYSIERNGKLKGKILASDDFTFIDFESQSLKIDRLRFCLTEKKYHLKNYQTETTAATLEFLSSGNECILNITEGSTYFFHKNQAARNILNPKTWLSFEHHLTDSIDDISFLGSTPLSSLPNGIIDSTNDQLILPILAGLSIIEESIRTYRETSG